MLGRFKFRAWNENSKTMFKVCKIDSVLETLRVSTIRKPRKFSFLDFDAAVLLQWTGMEGYKKKRSGGTVCKLIFEGDYVRRKSQYPGDKDFEGVVTWLEGSWAVNDAVSGKSRPLFDGFCAWEVIGNIYENPELLEGD